MNASTEKEIEELSRVLVFRASPVTRTACNVCGKEHTKPIYAQDCCGGLAVQVP